MGCPYVHPYFRTLLQMSSADESRFLEVLVTHNEPVMWLDWLALSVSPRPE
jgi:hypothetical protein